MVDGWLGFNDVGAREIEKENTSGTVGGNGAGDEKVITPSDLYAFWTRDQPCVGCH